MSRRTRLLAVGGIVGPAAFVGTWAIAGAATPGYSLVSNAISDLAAVDASTRVAMTTALVVDGLGIIAFGLACRDVVDGPAWIAAVATGVDTLGVAASPLRGWTGDQVHAGFAAVSYVATSALPILAAGPLARSGRPTWARASVAAGVISAVALLASTAGPAHGLFQRLGLTVADVWIATAAAAIVTRRFPNPALRRR
ncbi:MAG: DUF998 domain-containing protein [Acidimicrobiia bacterium]